ncbi:hypothetical protein N9Q74_01910 [Ascidiaceihabitans sp.]|nr:hypothetical protein [Ascidiaceihabitans sp.]
MRFFALICVIPLVACTPSSQIPSFDGIKFRTKLSKVDKQRVQFSVTVLSASQSLAGAREAGRYEATKYCINQYGTSDIAWMSGPDVEDGGLTITNDQLQLRGACLS